MSRQGRVLPTLARSMRSSTSRSMRASIGTAASFKTKHLGLSTDDKLAVKVYRSFIRTMAERLRRVNAQLSKAQAFSPR